MNAPLYSLRNKKIWVAGHGGLVGSALVRALEGRGHRVLKAGRAVLDCRDQAAVMAWMQANRPDAVIVAAAKVGGIGANISAPAEFLYDNLIIEANIIHGAYVCGVEKLLFLGSSCIYPKDAPNPITPDALLGGALEPTNAPYALAKIAGIELCRSYRRQYDCDFIAAMPCNVYGVGDRFDAAHSHVIPALLMRAHQGKARGERIFSVWGSGRPRREFIYADDLAAALLMLLEGYSGEEPVNIGGGDDITIAALAALILQAVDWSADIVFDAGQPDGVARKLLDSSVMRGMGWAPSTPLPEGLRRSYDWFCRQKSGLS